MGVSSCTPFGPWSAACILEEEVHDAAALSLSASLLRQAVFLPVDR